MGHIFVFFLLRKRVTGSRYDTEEEQQTISFKLKKIDWIGMTLFLSSCTCLVLALLWGGSVYPWRNARIIVLLILGGILGILFVVVEWLFENENVNHAPKFLQPIFVHGSAMIPLEIFKDWDVTICQSINFVGGMAILGMFYYIAIYFTIVFLYPPQQAGQQLLYFLPGLGVGAWSAIFFVRRVFRGTKAIMVLGSIIVPVAIGLFSMAIRNKIKSEVFGFMAMLGVGVGLV